MATAAPPVGSLIVGGAAMQGDLAELVQSITKDTRVGAVGELSIVLIDDRLATFRSGFANEGTPIQFGSGSYQVADRTIDRAGGLVTVRARSTLARAMRKKYRVAHEKKVSPAAWIKQIAKSHGGTAMCGASPVKGAISQSNKQSELDVLNSVCGDPDWIWAEYGNRIYAGTAYYWWEWTRTKDWLISWQTNPATDAVNITGGFTPDDTDAFGTIDVTVAYELGIQMAPMHRLVLVDSAILDGVWLVTAAAPVMDGSSDVNITAIRPHKPHPKKGSR